MAKHLLDTYPRIKVNFVDGMGCFLIDDQNHRYLDAIAGLAVSTLGHKHQALVAAMQMRALKPLQISNLFTIAQQETLAEQLSQLTGLTHAYFGNSGAEANEAAIKMARIDGVARGIETPKIITFKNSFHGRTYGAASATNNTKVQTGIGPLLPGFIALPYDDLEAVKAVKDKEVVAVLVEAIQGDGGINIPQPGYLKGLRELCDQRNWFLIIDEVQTACGRTGLFCAYQHEEMINFFAKNFINSFSNKIYHLINFSCSWNDSRSNRPNWFVSNY